MVYRHRWQFFKGKWSKTFPRTNASSPN